MPTSISSEASRGFVKLKKASMPNIGHLLTADGVKADPSKEEAILHLTKLHKMYKA